MANSTSLGARDINRLKFELNLFVDAYFRYVDKDDAEELWPVCSNFTPNPGLSTKKNMKNYIAQETDFDALVESAAMAIRVVLWGYGEELYLDTEPNYALLDKIDKKFNN